MPHTVNRSLEQFGGLGLVFVVLSWLITFCVVVTLGIAVGYLLAHESPLARRLGTPAEEPEQTPAAGR